MVDPDPALDFTATKLRIEPDASGTIAVLIQGQGVFQAFGTDILCPSFGRPVPEVVGEMEAAGYIANVTFVSLAESPSPASYRVGSAVVTGSGVSIIAQPLDELPDALPQCK